MADDHAEIKHPTSNADLFQLYRDKFWEALKASKIAMKVGDLVKMIELQQKLATSKGAQEQFWELIEQLRQEELKDGK